LGVHRKLTSDAQRSTLNDSTSAAIDLVDLNHIFLFLAVISPLLVLARAWRPGAPYHGWRVAAIVVLAFTAVAWILAPRVAGYIGGLAWIVLLFVPAIGSRKMTEFAARGNYKSAATLGTILQVLHPSAELRDQVRLFRHLESRQNHPVAFTSAPVEKRVRHSQLRSAPAVLVLILLNVLAFLLEFSVGDLNDPEVLHRAGALEPYSVVAQGEYWRLFTALFLHGGFTHLLFNVFALYVLGPALERSIGTIRFAACYLLSGLASGAGVVGLTLVGLVQVSQLVGASGSVMGVVGAWAGFLIRHRHVPQAKQRLGNIVMIIVIQIAFDLSTPQVSMAAHLCGLIAGFFLGLTLARKQYHTRMAQIHAN
jgi:membrane associated rhomboid family serine protease